MLFPVFTARSALMMAKLKEQLNVRGAVNLAMTFANPSGKTPRKV